MSDQIELLLDDDDKLAAAAAERHLAIEDRFRAFHAANPRVYAHLVRFAKMLRDRGYHRCGIRLIWERMRWEMMLSTSDPQGFKLNNDYVSRYARLIMAEEPELREFFRTRELRRR